MRNRVDEPLCHRTDHFNLTDAELRILRLLADGCSREGIAERLSLSVHTVKSHLERAYGKLGVHNGTAAVAKLIRTHVLPEAEEFL